MRSSRDCGLRPKAIAAYRLLGAAVPLVYFATYFHYRPPSSGVWWDWNVMLGAMHLGRRHRLRADAALAAASAKRIGAWAQHSPLAAFLAHAATSWRYGYFRDELYFIACSKHLSWGYVDQPPLVAFAAWLSAPLHYNIVALRILPGSSGGAHRLACGSHRARTWGRTIRASARRACDAAASGVFAARQHADDDVLRTAVVDVAPVRDDSTRANRRRSLLDCRGAPPSHSACTASIRCCCSPSRCLPACCARKQRRLMLTRLVRRGCRAARSRCIAEHLVAGAHGWPFAQVVRGDFAAPPRVSNRAATRIPQTSRRTPRRSSSSNSCTRIPSRCRFGSPA